MDYIFCEINLHLWSTVVAVEIDLDNYSIREGDGLLEVCLDLTGQLARDITINITSIDMTALGKNIYH